ncbi:RNA polymerase-binding protein RbpA [Aquiluna borgnonia]|uniref:RNA polymerase-binding protein RbpA n=1 Tax=Aquiluna borgnonia TaxID=2499157 RepID=A0A7D4UDD6_9MICO|nr:RNA polymerase-binding protein RbpA [Aquiluna borgnonia]QKJ25354.1 RNA polymerase-binding protein RbpA [Aquiluna borgnonia]
MAETMRGMRLGAQSLENESGVEFAKRQTAHFRCAANHQFNVVFSLEAELPQTWECNQCAAIGIREEAGVPVEVTGISADEKRSHYDMVLERRSREELEELLEEMLAQMRERRAKGRLSA